MKSAMVLFEPLGRMRVRLLPFGMVVMALFAPLVGGCDKPSPGASQQASANAAAPSTVAPSANAAGTVASSSSAAPAKQGPKPKRCRLDEVGGIQFEITLEGDPATHGATREALALRAAQLNPNCRSRINVSSRGVHVEVFDLRALAASRPRTLTAPGVVWAAPWLGDVPKPGEPVKRPAKAVVLKVVSATPTKDGPAGALYGIVMKLAPASASAFGELSGRHVGQKLAIGYDDRILAMPQVVERIDTGEVRVTLGAVTPGSIVGQDAERLARQLARPALAGPARLTSMNQIGPTKARKPR